MELLVLVLAQLVRDELQLDAPIYTDCTAALKALTRPERLRYKSKKPNLLLLSAGRKLERAAHVRSHPKRYSKDRSTWNRFMFGNHIADRVCMGDYASVDITAPGARGLTYTMSDVMDLVTEQNVWYWSDLAGKPTLKSYDQLRNSHALEEYLTGRDIRRAMAGLEPKWATRSVRFAAAAADLHMRCRGDLACLCRIAWDQVLHGGNKTKFEMPGDHSCQLCGGIDSAEHWMAQCPGEKAVVNRRSVSAEIEDYIASIPTREVLTRSFAYRLRWVVEEAPGSGMHRMGMYLREVVDAIFQSLGITLLNANDIVLLRKCATQMTKIWIAGVLDDHSLKMTGKKKQSNALYMANLERQRMKKALAAAAARHHREWTDATREANRQAKIHEYFEMERRDL